MLPRSGWKALEIDGYPIGEVQYCQANSAPIEFAKLGLGRLARFDIHSYQS